MWEYIGSWNDPNYMAHSGVKGQKWGVRRYQNEDGSLTPEGRRHYTLLAGGTALGAAAAAGLGHYIGGTGSGKAIRGYLRKGNLRAAGTVVGKSLRRTATNVGKFANRTFNNTKTATANAINHQIPNRYNASKFAKNAADAQRMADLAGHAGAVNGTQMRNLLNASRYETNAANARRMADLAGHAGGSMMPLTANKKAIQRAVNLGNASGYARNATNARRMADLAGHAGGAYMSKAAVNASKASKARRMADLAGHAGGSMMKQTVAQKAAGYGKKALRTATNAATNFYANNRGAVIGTGAGLGAIGAGAATAGIVRSVDRKKSKKRR